MMMTPRIGFSFQCSGRVFPGVIFPISPTYLQSAAHMIMRYRAWICNPARISLQSVGGLFRGRALIRADGAVNDQG